MRGDISRLSLRAQVVADLDHVDIVAALVAENAPSGSCTGRRSSPEAPGQNRGAAPCCSETCPCPAWQGRVRRGTAARAWPGWHIAVRLAPALRLGARTCATRSGSSISGPGVVFDRLDSVWPWPAGARQGTSTPGSISTGPLPQSSIQGVVRGGARGCASDRRPESGPAPPRTSPCRRCSVGFVEQRRAQLRPVVDVAVRRGDATDAFSAR